MSKLTDKQELFCLEYITDLNATKAAIRAGYKPDNARQIGSENLSKLDVSERIQELKATREEKLEIDADWVLKQAVKVHEKCMEDDGMGDFKFEPAGANKSLELIGKHVSIGCFKDKVDVIHKFGSMSDSELDKEIEGMSHD